MSPQNLNSLGDLKRDPRNPRKHGERNLQQIEQSLKSFGAGRSIVIDEKNQILAGNGLVEAAGNIGLSKLVVVDATGEEIVAVRRRGLTERQKSEYRIADNRSAELAEWDPEVLAAMAEEINLAQFWTDEELEALLAQEPEQSDVDAEPQTDRAAELQEHWKVERGQVWQLGNHRLMCGDCTNGDDVARLMDGEKAGVVVTDPPYGIGYSPGGGGRGWSSKTFSGDNLVRGDSVPFNPAALLEMGLPTVLWGANHYSDKLPARASWLIWDKRDDKVHNDFADCELAWCSEGFPARVFRHLWNGAFRASERGEKRQHPTQKAIAVMVWCLGFVQGDPVLDPFLGSGTTLIAAEQLNRRCFAMEIEERYVSVCLQRFQDATQKEPKLLK